MRYDQPPNRKRVNLTVREDVLSDAKALGLNASRAAEAGIEEAVRAEKGRRWREDGGSCGCCGMVIAEDLHNIITRNLVEQSPPPEEKKMPNPAIDEKF